MTKEEDLRTRVILAQSIGVPPDDVVEGYENVGGIFGVNYKGYTLVMGFCRVPTLSEAREAIKNLYLAGVELEFDEEMKAIK